ncbi:hypothetical protein P692DRAFT_20835261, partial [Suillus brevipes Sb2]
MESFLVTKSNNQATTVTVTKEPPTSSNKAHHTARLPLACYLTVHPRNISNICHLSDLSGEPESVINIFNGNANVALQNPGIFTADEARKVIKTLLRRARHGRTNLGFERDAEERPRIWVAEALSVILLVRFPHVRRPTSKSTSPGLGLCICYGHV